MFSQTEREDLLMGGFLFAFGDFVAVKEYSRAEGTSLGLRGGLDGL